MAACASGGVPPPPTAGYARSTYVVRPHDTLYSIAWRHDVDYRDLAKWNGIGPDYKLVVGQVLILGPTATAAPPAATASSPRAATASPQASPAAPRAAAAASSQPAAPRPAEATPAQPPAASRAAAAAAEPAGAQWTWPTDRLSPPRPVPGGGILLFGRLGQDVRAAGSGRVVYTGSGLRGYGNLVIIKHGDSLLTSYAHNRELLVHEGQEVAMGEVIAHMGLGPHQVCALYFEVRVNGKPKDPLKYLAYAR